MKKFVFCTVLVVIIVTITAYLTGYLKLNAGLHAGFCGEDDEIVASQREAMNSSAMAFVQALLEQHPETAWSMMTKEAQATVSAKSFSDEFRPFVQDSGPFTNVRLEHSFFIQDAGGGPNGHTVCGTLAGGDWVSLETKPGLSQAHIVIASQTKNNDWAFTLWLLQDGDNWRVEYFHAGISSIVGVTPAKLLERARQERDSGHAFNAAMLYAGVQGTVDRGPAFQLGFSQSLQDDLQKFSVPPELAGKPPFVWNMKGVNYTVSQVTIIGVDKKIGLMFLLPQSVWNGEQDADGRNRAFINAFLVTHPDYSRVFKFLVARTLKPDNSGGFGTVYENGKGFD